MKAARQAKPVRNLPQTIGLLGGSFNPAHAGHVHLSLIARKQLGLDAVWWLVSPQNPLKPREGMADYQHRAEHAQQLTRSIPSILVSRLEQRHGLFTTRDCVLFLTRHYPHHRFVWLMGADNLRQFHRWYRWQEIARTIPIAICDRAPHAHAGLRCPAALRLHWFRLPAAQSQRLPHRAAPCWTYLFMPRHSESATALRKAFGAQAFLGHNKQVDASPLESL